MADQAESAVPTGSAPPTGPADVRTAAIERLKNKRAFGQDLVSYVVVNSFLIGVWAITGAGYFWPAWIMGAWGIGLVMHAWTAFFQKPITEADIEREMRRGGHAGRPPARPPLG